MKANLLERLNLRTTKSDTCWVWQGCTNAYGYGAITVDGKTKGVHRVMYELVVGKIPEGLVLDHLCKNKLCLNPNHLEPVTTKENTIRGDRTVLSRSKVKKIKELCTKGLTQEDIANIFGTHQSSISRIINGKIWIES